MLDNNDLLKISNLLEENNKKNNKLLKEEIVGEIVGAVNDGFTEMQKQLDGMEGKITGMDGKIGGMEGRLGKLQKDMELRPTLSQIMNWGDNKIVNLELRTDKLDYLHLKELDNLPPAPEISQALMEHGFKKKTV